ncbi:NADPH-dependent FMN reductase [Roseateles paludis]|jgi:FMN reductase|uniref:NADPH-dependent FMN reductase n=1 Tax=Roseateles paludis TaxID=3145238 RepID=A0ABV0G7I0_9BURK
MKLVRISGSPSAHSRSHWLLALAVERLQPQLASLIAVRELPAEALLGADVHAAPIAAALQQVLEADVVLVSTPIYKAAYSGLLKTFLDLLPQDALRGKRVLPLATGGSAGHLLALDYALRPVLNALGARQIADGVFATDAQLPRGAGNRFEAAPELLARLDVAVAGLLALAPLAQPQPS